MPIRGAVADLSAIIKAQAVSQLIVASRYIKSDRLHQALSVCQERRIRLGGQSLYHPQPLLMPQLLLGNATLPSGIEKKSEQGETAIGFPPVMAEHYGHTLTIP